MTSKIAPGTTAPTMAKPGSSQPTELDLLDPELYRSNPQELWAETRSGAAPTSPPGPAIGRSPLPARTT